MSEDSVCVEDEFSRININKSPTRRKKVYPQNLYPPQNQIYFPPPDPPSTATSPSSTSDTNNTSNTINNNTIITNNVIANTIKKKSLSTTKIHPSDKRLLSYPMSEKAASKQDYQFSFMRETSSSIQKKHSTYSGGLSKPNQPYLTTGSATKKRLEYSRQLSHNLRSRRLLSSNFPSKTSPSDITNLPYSLPAKYGGMPGEDSPTKQKVIRNASQPLPLKSVNNVFNRLYPNSLESEVKPRVAPEKVGMENKDINSVKVNDITELFSILYAFDEQLFPNEGDSDCPEAKPIQAVELAKLKMNIYERGEIIRKQQLYFVPQGIERNLNIKNYQNNFGFDDANGNYIIVEGDHINYRFEVLKMLGNGSFGNVIMSKDHKYSSRLVATKIIKNDLNWSLQAINEIKMLRLLNEKETNENILKYYDHFNFRSHMCIVTELLSINLYSLLEVSQFRGFSLNIVQSITKQILNGLQYMHRLNVIHCDIKPENIMIQLPHSPQVGTFVVKIIDFGSSCLSNEISFTYIQSRFYRAPEVIIGANYTEGIDVWSLGCVIAELFTGVPLLPGKNEIEQVGLILELFGAPKSTTILRLRKSLTRSVQKKSFEMNENSPHVNEKLIKKTLLFRLFDINGKINMSLLNYHNANSTAYSAKKQFKLNSRNLEIYLSLNKCPSQLNKSFLRFLQKIFVWDPVERSSILQLTEEPFVTSQD
ncbi:serine-threonine protein kinase [Scheffersomyces stipitis CBS 6054]|uniref:Serine-threonine protein kinase n=1 Tax=Scheffersomyces stipitis (strain ATCC 58785 / CBS 6054 / NBRC 10063 / NRRL Y-11545) TaxID=322104 RepID=A3LPP5_PICST|nr:serine-threonine protein kinase [Scheffersomyces stipitis CBS 6054]ABN65077.2 serine-threonine protein kinase [Scheffersomyces stipitis CBS 6054]